MKQSNSFVVSSASRLGKTVAKVVMLFCHLIAPDDENISCKQQPQAHKGRQTDKNDLDAYPFHSCLLRWMDGSETVKLSLSKTHNLFAEFFASNY